MITDNGGGGYKDDDEIGKHGNKLEDANDHELCCCRWYAASSPLMPAPRMRQSKCCSSAILDTIYDCLKGANGVNCIPQRFNDGGSCNLVSESSEYRD